MNTVDLVFPCAGGPIPTDHAYSLFGALSRLVPAFHQEGGPRFLPISGQSVGEGQLALAPSSRLRVRLPADAIRTALPLAGKRLEMDGRHVRLGVPSVQALAAPPSLFCRLVAIKQKENPKVELAPFMDAVRRRLADLGVEGEPSVPIFVAGGRAGEPMRRVIRIHAATVVGYALIIEGLSAEHSLKLQEVGLGGRLRMGCGFFVPARGEMR